MRQESPTTKIIYVPLIDQITFKQVLAKVAYEAEIDPAAAPPFVETEIIPDPLAGRLIDQKMPDNNDIYAANLRQILEADRRVSRTIRYAVQYTYSSLLAFSR